MIPTVKKSLRAKLTLLLLFVGVIPLTIASVFFYLTSRDALFKAIFKELKWNVTEASSMIETQFERTAKDLLLSSQNVAFKMYFRPGENKAYWWREQNKTLAQLRALYPEILDEACYIESTGREISRIVLDEVTPPERLSSEEERTTFFKGAFSVADGEIYIGRPTISEDTWRWVVPLATPVTVNGGKAAILHMEVSMEYFQRLLKSAINPERGYAFILDDAGNLLAHTAEEVKQNKPLVKAASDSTPPVLAAIYGRMAAGETNVEQFQQGGKDYYVSYQPVNASLSRVVNENRWSIAYVLPGDKVTVEMTILRQNATMIALTLAAVAGLAAIIGSYFTRPIRRLADATTRLAAGELARVEVAGSDELGRLSESFNSMAEAVKRRDEELKALAVRDGLTGLYNHRHFKAELERESRAALRFSRPLSFIMADIDHFKKFNDTYGHRNGDVVLKQVGAIITKATREVDIAARYGGEEFCLILPETSRECAATVAERLRAHVEAESFKLEGGHPDVKVTLSLGVASLPEDALDDQALVEAADKALYVAKKEGRNRVRLASAPEA